MIKCVNVLSPFLVNQETSLPTLLLEYVPPTYAQGNIKIFNLHANQSTTAQFAHCSNTFRASCAVESGQFHKLFLETAKTSLIALQQSGTYGVLWHKKFTMKQLVSFQK
jgi:hypothetical protein